MTRQKEALSLIQHMVDALSAHPRDLDLKAMLRRGQHACELLGWPVRKQWFQQELNGYAREAPVPRYRVIRGILSWAPAGGLLDRTTWASQEILFGRDTAGPQAEEITFDARGSIDWLIDATARGYTEPTDWTLETPAEPLSRTIILRAVKVFPPASFAAALAGIQQAAFDFASQAHAQLLADLAAQDEGAVERDGSSAQTRLFLILSGERVSLSDLKDVCLLVGADWDALPGDAKNAKARALVQYAQQRARLSQLRDALLQLRPDLAGLCDEP
jgi:hypothetical protein